MASSGGGFIAIIYIAVIVLVFAALWHIVAKMRRDELLVLQHLLQKCTHLLPACRAGIGLERTVTRGSKLFEGM